MNAGKVNIRIDSELKLIFNPTCKKLEFNSRKSWGMTRRGNLLVKLKKKKKRKKEKVD